MLGLIWVQNCLVCKGYQQTTLVGKELTYQFEIIFFKRNLLGIPSECQTVWIQISSNVLLGLICVQNFLVCKGYQQTTLVGKELTYHFEIIFFKKKSFGNTIRVSNSLDPDQAQHFLLGLIWVQNCLVCKGYQQTTLVGKELTYQFSAIQQIAENCTQLQTVYLRRCLNITDDAIVRLSRRCPRLRLLNIGGCQQITDQSLEALGQNSNYLKSINLSNTKVKMG